MGVGAAGAGPLPAACQDGVLGSRSGDRGVGAAGCPLLFLTPPPPSIRRGGTGERRRRGAAAEPLAPLPGEGWPVAAAAVRERRLFSHLS